MSNFEIGNMVIADGRLGEVVDVVPKSNRNGDEYKVYDVKVGNWTKPYLGYQIKHTAITSAGKIHGVALDWSFNFEDDKK